jgi:hypothetical protein
MAETSLTGRTISYFRWHRLHWDADILLLRDEAGKRIEF